MVLDLPHGQKKLIQPQCFFLMKRLFCKLNYRRHLLCPQTYLLHQNLLLEEVSEISSTWTLWELPRYACKIRGFGDFFRKNCSLKINKNITIFRAHNFSTAFDIFRHFSSDNFWQFPTFFDIFWQFSKPVENCRKLAKAVESLLKTDKSSRKFASSKTYPPFC